MSIFVQQHPAYQRVYNAVESLALVSGKDDKKFEAIWLNLFPLQHQDFRNEEERKLHSEIISFFRENPPSWNYIPREDWPHKIPASNLSWQRKKCIKKKVLLLFRAITSSC